MNRLLAKIPALLLTLTVGLFASSSAFATATIVIQNADAPNVGFNDPSPPVPGATGNSGATLGEQRLIAFQAAANIWGATLVSSQTITIHASWSTTLTCGTTSGVLGSAGTTSLRANFTGAVLNNAWYPIALAEALAGSNLNSATAEINAQFNSNVGTSGCLTSSHWYYGLDGIHGVGGLDLVTVLLHEFGHGLGFASFTDETTGVQPSGVINGVSTPLPGVYDFFLLDKTTGKHWPVMTNAERQASAINAPNLVWDGPQVTSDDAAPVLTAGKDTSGHPLIYAPSTVESGSSVSHWDKTESPNQLMEPNISSDLTHSVSISTNRPDLTFSALRDIGWCSGCAQPPPPSPTPTPSPPPNDNFANAQVVTGCSGSVTGSNLLATKEVGEPIQLQASSGSMRSVWYQWQAPSTGSATITTSGSDFDTILSVYTGSSVGGLTLVPNGTNDDVVPGSDVTSSVTINVTQGTLYSIAVNGFDNDGTGGDTGNIKLNWSESSCAPPPPTVRLTASDFPVSENVAAGFVTVSVIREGDATSAASVNYATSDTAGLTPCSQGGTGKASERCDYATSLGTLSWAAGEAGTKTFNIPIINDAIVEGTETFNVTLSNPTGVSLGTPSTATVTILDDDTNPAAPNPIDGVDFFITQQYIDFLGRMPDAGGFANWQATLAPCPNGGFGEFDNPSCDRIHVAAGFFQSQEFLDRGYWAFCFYMVSYNQRPTYAQFIPDMAVVGGSQSPAQSDASKAAFSDAFVLRPEFVAKYPGLSGQPLANALWLTAGLPGSPITAGSLTKGQILRTIVETSAAFNKFLPDGTVAIQYFGFLRRDPDTNGYQNNLTTLRNDPNNLRHMIFIFIYSSEYRGRFGTP
jgi:hypothetical protein